MKIENSNIISKEQFLEVKNICNSLNKYLSKFDLSGFRDIRIVEKGILNPSSDGNFKNGEILIPKDKIQYYLKKGEKDVIKSTIYHELCHVDYSNKLPKLHMLHEKYCKEENFIKAFTIMIYIEYLTHLKSIKMESKKLKSDFYDSINNYNYDFTNPEHRVYFIKTTPYIISRDVNIKNIKNEKLKKNIEEVKKELIKLPTKQLVDKYDILCGLEKIVSKYISND